MQFAQGSQFWNNASGAGTVYTISGLGFQPKALMFYCVGMSTASDISGIDGGSNARVSMGFATSTSNRRCQGFMSVVSAVAADCQEIYRDDAVVATVSAAGVVDGLLDLNSITSGGFTLIVDDAAPINLRVFWLAWGGDDIVNASVGEIVEPAATGVQSYSVTGWISPLPEDNVVLFAGCQLTAAAPTAAVQDAGFMFGAATATGAGSQFVCASNEDDGSATMDTLSYIRGDECLAMMTVAGGNPNARASFNGFDSLGFDLSWTARAVTNRRYIYLAIQGGKWKAGNYTIDLTTIGNTTTVSGLLFSPIGAIHVSADRAQSAAGVSTTGAMQNWGVWSSLTARRNMRYFSENGTAIAEINLAIEVNEGVTFASLPTSPDPDWFVDIDAINSDGFRVIVTTPETTPHTDFQPYLAFGGEQMITRLLKGVG